MSNPRQFVIESSYLVLYVGIAAGMVTLTALLLLTHSLDIELGQAHHTASMVTTGGWLSVLALPFLYRWLAGRPFRWRSDEMVDGGSSR